jgi:hypothetical protein
MFYKATKLRKAKVKSYVTYIDITTAQMSSFHAPIVPVKQFLPNEMLTKPLEPVQQAESSKYEDEELVPIRIDLVVDNFKVTDNFLWNLYGKVFLNSLLTK